MRILVCGGRDYENVAKLWAELDAIDIDGVVRLVVDGGAAGADYWAHQWALARNKPYHRYFADWKTHGKAAGPIRNQRMLDEGNPDLVVAFPGGKGTADMVDRATKANIKVIRVTTP